MDALTIPSALQVRAALQDLKRPQLDRLATLSGVSVHTIIKIAAGKTTNPGIDTCRSMMRHLPTVRAEA